MERTVAFSVILAISGIAILAILLVFQTGNSKSMDVQSNLGPEVLNLPNANLTDDQLIRKTYDFKEVKLLLTKYPNADRSVDRLYESDNATHDNFIFVTYKVEKNIDNASGRREMELRVILVPQTNKTSDIQVSCRDFDPKSPPQLSFVTMINLENDVCFR